MDSSGLLLFVQVGLLMFILTLLYNFISIELNFIAKKPVKPAHNKFNHFAIIYNKSVSEKEFIQCINNLIQFHYKNFKAYFVCNEPFLQSNHSEKFVVINQSNTNNVIETIKPHVDELTDAVILIQPDSALNSDFLLWLNQEFNKGNQLIIQKPDSLSYHFKNSRSSLLDFLQKQLNNKLQNVINVNFCCLSISYALFKNMAINLLDNYLIEMTDRFYEKNKTLQLTGFYKFIHYTQIKSVYGMFKWLQQSFSPHYIFSFYEHGKLLKAPLFTLVSACMTLMFINLMLYNRLQVFSFIAFIVISVSMWYGVYRYNLRTRLVSAKT